MKKLIMNILTVADIHGSQKALKKIEKKAKRLALERDFNNLKGINCPIIIKLMILNKAPSIRPLATGL